MAKSDFWYLKSGLVPYEGHLWKGMLAWTGMGYLWSFLAENQDMIAWGLRKTDTNEHLKFSSCHSWWLIDSTYHRFC